MSGRTPAGKNAVLIDGRPSDVPKMLVSVEHQVTVKKGAK
jgi:hypothetical protein